MEVIKKEIKINEKYLSETISQHERLRYKHDARVEAERVKLEAYQKNQNELKEFKKSK